MLLDLNHKFKNLKKEELPDATLAEVLADMLSVRVDGVKPIKAYDWALKLQETGVIDIDRDDAEALEKGIEKSDKWNLVKAQLILAIRQAKENIKD